MAQTTERRPSSKKSTGNKTQGKDPHGNKNASSVRSALLRSLAISDGTWFEAVEF